MTDLRQQLNDVYKKRGELTPQIVLDEARDPDHPLHSRFTWDDSEAAEKWRRHEAHELIVRVKVSYTDSQQGLRETRAFHAIRGETGHIYKPVDEILEDDISRQILLRDMEREWRTLQRRYASFVEFVDMVKRDITAA